MTGLEIAGLLLAVLPVLFQAVDLSGESIQRARISFRKRIYVGKLARAILLQKQILAETIKSLAIASGCEDVWRLDDDPFGYLNCKSVRRQISEYLGHDNDAAFGGALDRSHEIVKKIAGNIADLVPSIKGPCDDLLYIIKVNQEAKEKPADFVRKLRLMFKVKELKKAVEEIDNITSTLDRFTRVLLSNRQVTSDSPSRKAARLENSLRRVRGFATSLHLAIAESWQGGCHTQHEARLFLEDRIDSVGNVLEAVNKKNTGPLLVFQLIFAASFYQGLVVSHETEVEVLRDETDVQPAAGSSSRVKIVAAQPKALATPDVAFVSDICGAIEAATSRQRRASFVLTKNRQMGIIHMHDKPLLPCCEAKVVTLRELLQPANNNSFQCGQPLPLKHRMQLALRLASNLLQLLQTKWMQTAWSKETIYFRIKPQLNENDMSKELQLDFGRPFVSLIFDKDNKGEEPSQNVEPKAVLLELGILLLEIWHKMTLETRFRLDGPVGYYKRLALAFEWLDDMSDPLPQLYDTAVSHCIRGIIGGESRFTDWDDLHLWKAICDDIIEPLSKNCKQWR